MIKLKDKYQKEVIPAMKEKFGYRNDMAVPKIEKVVVNTGFGRQVAGKTGDEPNKYIESVLADLAMICGQKAIPTKAKKSIASFKVRQGMILGAKTSLRGRKMLDFLERLINLVLPRTRDFKGVEQKSIDGNGNLTLAVREHIAFPEILPEKARNIFGLEITIATSAKTKEEGVALFKLLGFPIKND